VRTVRSMADRDSSIPTGRLRRTARVGGLVSRQAAKAYATKAANVARSGDGRQAASERRQLEAAEEIVEVLGSMKGAAMKVGQVASFIDTGVVPPEAQERFQAKLAELRDAAPPVSFAEMRGVIEDDLEDSLDQLFAELEPRAVASASIGQVYRARLHDGRRVAVKVQYPGVARAVRADLQNMGLILRAAKRIAPGMDAKAMAAEIRARLGEELDYEHEAQNQRAFARTWRGHPFVVVPDVITRLSRERVLVTEWVDGLRFEDVKRLGQPERDRFGEIVFRFFMGSLYRTGHFSGDPHPGNFLLMEDGRVAFLDFGMTKRVPPEQIAGEVAVIRSGLQGDAEGVHAGLAALGFFDVEDPGLDPSRVLDHFRAATAWYREDRPFTIDAAYVRRVMIDIGDPRSEYWELMKRQTMPAQAMLARRMEALTLGVLGQLEATANWHRISREWLFGEPPATALGEAEAGFFGSAAGPGREQSAA
jgi:predicted unusual protein kinase regulating ubiquinone biosynthesis (AarF/ABC1/UbiB family)